MTASSFFALVAAWVAVLVAPGPDLFQVMRQGIRSRDEGLWSALGVITGASLWIVSALVGLAALLSARPVVLAWLQLIGGSYLIYLGVRSIAGGLRERRASRNSRVIADAASAPTSGAQTPGRPEPAPQQGSAVAPDSAAAPAPNRGRAYLAGLTTNLSNPKALLFFGAIFAQFITPGMGWQACALVAITMIAMGFAWFAGVAVAVRAVAGPLGRAAALVDILTGAFFSAIGCFIAVEGLRTLLR